MATATGGTDTAKPFRTYRVIVKTAMTVILGEDSKDETDEQVRASIANRWGDRLISVEQVK